MIYDELCLDNAIIFNRTADILNERFREGLREIANNSKGIDGKAELDVALVISVSVNCAFACELLIKSMLPKNTWPKNADEHKLDVLFNELDADIQDKIKNNVVKDMKKLDANYNDSLFQNDLVKYGNTFIEWRYFHEKGTLFIGVEFLLRLMKAVREVAIEERA